MGSWPEDNAYAQKLIGDRYRQRGTEETATDIFRRIAHQVIQSPVACLHAGSSPLNVLEERIYQWMLSGEGCPAGRILANCGGIGSNMNGNCFALPVHDSRESIYRSLGEMSEIEAYGGGVGFNFSELRPAGWEIKKLNGVSSGPVAFIDIFDKSVGTISQGGSRRGAAIGVLNIDHPDIRSFIQAKSDPENRRWTNFNVSVGVTNAFMQAVKDDTEFHFRWGDWVDPNPQSARRLFREIAEAAWSTGEPGVFFLDTVNQKNPLNQVEVLQAVNPCVPLDTWVQTSEGPRQVQELMGVPFTALVRGVPYEVPAPGFFATGTQKVLHVVTQQGFELSATPNHLWATVKKNPKRSLQSDGLQDIVWVATQDLRLGDTIVVNRHANLTWSGEGTEEEGYLLGLFLGDGVFCDGTARVDIWPTSSDSVKERVRECLQQVPHRSDCGAGVRSPVWSVKSKRLTDWVAQLGIVPGHKTLTPSVERLSSACTIGILRGLFDADGAVGATAPDKGLSVRLSQSSKEFLQIVQRMLLRLGVYSTLYQNRRSSGTHHLPDGRGGYREYPIKAQHELCISRDSILVFQERIGFGDTRKANQLASALQRMKRRPYRGWDLATVSDIVTAGEVPVGDVQIPGINAFDANGFLVHNCGELPLNAYGMCALSSLNLSVFVEQGHVSWRRLERSVRTGVQFLDLLIDTSFFPLPEIRDEVLSKRKIGLGVFGLADMLFLKGLPYGNHPKTLAFLHNLFGFIEQTALSESEHLADIIEPFPLWEQSGLETPRRNGTLLSMAPTGSISSLYGASWGIEPYFAVSMVRNERLGVDQVSFRVLEQWRQEHPGQAWPEHLKLVHSDDASRVLSVEDHLAVLGVVAEHVDNAVSKTVNLPKSASVEDVESAFLHAWEAGIKGLTVFRDQCKRAAAITPVVEEKAMEFDLFDEEGDDDMDDEDVAREAEVVELAESMVEDILSKPKDRPDKVTATTYHIKYAPDKPALYITIGDVEEDPFEIFINTEDSLMREGLDGLSLTLTALFRRGISCKFLVEKFLKYESALGGAFYKGKYVPSVLAAVGLVLKEHLQSLGAMPPDHQPELLRSKGSDAPPVHADRCPSCGEYAYIRQDGCGVCATCGFSSCG